MARFFGEVETNMNFLWQILLVDGKIANFATRKSILKQMNIVGKNLEKLRKANGFTQAQVADYLGIQRSTYSNYEAGLREAPLEVLERASALLGCELSLLFEEDADVVDEMLPAAFRVEGLSVNDMKEVAAFKNVVMNYLKMERLLAR